MGNWRDLANYWLSFERHLDEAAGADEATDAAFAKVFAALPAVEPSAAFVHQAVDAAWAARARSRRAAVFAGLAASVAVTASGAAVAYALLGAAGGWLLTSAVAAATRIAMSVLGAATTTLEWWLATVHVGGAMADVVTMPQGAAALATIGLIGVVALYMLRRLLQTELRFRGPRAFGVLA
ncbi:MAG: hypothetical protein HY824_01665 [Acidobacteria bacterium]|nr:hypothetical protein [Acidobacteriota bacterium]